MEENILKIAHQDGAQTFRLRKGGYQIDHNWLTDDEQLYISISIETENIDPDGWPSCALFSMHNCRIWRDIDIGTIFESDGGMRLEGKNPEGEPMAYAYFEFHALYVYVKWTVTEIRDNSIVFQFEAKHDDVDYYDERAKICPTHGLFVLSEISGSDFW